MSHPFTNPFINLSGGKVTIGGNVNITGNGPTQDIDYTDSNGETTVWKANTKKPEESKKKT